MVTQTLTRMYRRGRWSLLLRGLFGILVGVLVLMRPIDSVAVFALVIALWALVEGLGSIVFALELRPVAPHWGMLLVSGIVSTLFGGAALYYYPGLSLAFAVLWLALWLLVGGALGVFIAVQERRADLPWAWTMLQALVALLAAVFTIAYPGITLAGLIAVIATFAIIGGFARLITAWRLEWVEQRIDRVVRRPARA